MAFNTIFFLVVHLILIISFDFSTEGHNQAKK